MGNLFLNGNRYTEITLEKVRKVNKITRKKENVTFLKDKLEEKQNEGEKENIERYMYITYKIIVIQILHTYC